MYMHYLTISINNPNLIRYKFFVNPLIKIQTVLYNNPVAIVDSRLLLSWFRC